ncbi:MAG: glycosyltransferase [Treponema sp.]|nr:glycosyltransferase [Candidatus Treponema equifaecale]
MKIAMFTDAYYPRINGVTVSVHSYATELTKLGHEVTVVCLEYTELQQKNSLFDEKSSDNRSPFKIVRIPSMPLIFSKEDRMVRLDKWYRVKRAMKKFQPDVIHINSEGSVGYLGAIYAHHKHVPFVYTFHTMWEDYLANYVSFLPDSSLRRLGRDIVKFYLRRADVLIAPTHRISDVVESYGVKKSVEVLPTGIPDEKEKSSLIRQLQISKQLFKKFPQLRGKKIMLFVGRVVKEKNLAFLYDVLVEVQKKNPKTALLFVGAGPYLEELKELAEERNLASSVAFAGYMPSEDLVYFYKLASVFTFPSKTETQGLVTVEAMLAGLPVVAVGEMGTLDVMQGDNGGFMVQENVQEFAEKTLSLMRQPQLRKEKSLEAIKWAQQWKISSLTPKLVETYEMAVQIKKEQDAESKE